VYFATHGLIGGEIASLAEPALALTIPNEPTELEDGLLTASEVATQAQRRLGLLSAGRGANLA
jgi:hypothetical protein